MDIKTELTRLFLSAKTDKTSLRSLVPIIKQIPNAWEWIEEHCDKSLSKRHHAKKIYSAIHNGFKFTCPHNFEIGLAETLELYFPPEMKNSSICDCYHKYKESDYFKEKEKTKWAHYNESMLKNHGVARPFQNDAIKFKARKTNQKKYGVEFPSQLEQFERKKQLTNLERRSVTHPLKDITSFNKMVQTNLIKWGHKSPSQSPEIKDKVRKILQNKYGVHPTQLHIPESSRTILNDVELFSEYLSKSSVKQMSSELGVSESFIIKTHAKYGLSILQPNSSSYENEIANWLSSLNIPFIQHDRTTIYPYELDFKTPALAIEFNGLYYHSESLKSREYHELKTRLCKEKGVHLIHIFENEWNEKKEICKSAIMSQLGLGITIAGRKCLVREERNSNLKTFLNENHLQGWVNAKKAVVLEYNNEIVGCMTFGKSRYNKNVQWELLRLCFKQNTNIIGGAKKLWSHATKNFNLSSVVSYCDKRWFTGGIYKHLGFQLHLIGKPSYWYTDYRKVWHRSAYTKKTLIKLGHDKNLSQFYITSQILGLDKIWDCGQDTWIWERS